MKKYLPSLLAMSLILGGATAFVPLTYAKSLKTNQKRLEFQQTPQQKQQRLEHLATLLGMTSSDVQTKLDQGKNFKQIVQDSGLTPEQIKTRMNEQRKARLQELVTSGKMTQQQADNHQKKLSAPHKHGLGHFKPFMGGFKQKNPARQMK